MAPAVGWPAGGSSVGLELELGRLMGPSSDSVYLTAHSIHLTASIPQSPDRREFGQQLFGGSEVEHPAGMHHPDAAAQLLEDAGLGGVWPAAGAAVAAGVAAPDRVDRPWILPSRRARRRACTSSIRFWIAVAVNSGLGIRRASLRGSHMAWIPCRLQVPGCNERYPRSISYQVGRLGRRATAAWAYTLAGTGRRSHTRPSFARTSRVR